MFYGLFSQVEYVEREITFAVDSDNGETDDAPPSTAAISEKPILEQSAKELRASLGFFEHMLGHVGNSRVDATSEKKIDEIKVALAKMNDASQKKYTCRLFISKSATTELHLTGQILWPVTYVACWHALSIASTFQGKNVVEIGAGVGLLGLLVGQLSPKTMIITDGEDEIVELLQRNIEHSQNTESASSNTIGMKLWWGEEADVIRCVECIRKRLGDENAMVDVVIGADILAQALGDPAVPLSCAKTLLEHGRQTGDDRETKRFLCAYNVRDDSRKAYVDSVAKKLGFSMNEIDPATFLPDPLPESLTSVATTMRMLSFELP